MTLPPELKRAFHISKQLFSRARNDRAREEFEVEACRLAGKRPPVMTALRFLSARGNKEAQSFLDAFEYEYAKPAGDRQEMAKSNPSSALRGAWRGRVC
jgi:hypothetical protein